MTIPMTSIAESLVAAASRLNVASDELVHQVEELNAIIKPLNLGVTAWVGIPMEDTGKLDDEIWQIGHAKVEGEWGVAIRVQRGKGITQTWKFAGAPRKARIAGVDVVGTSATRHMASKTKLATVRLRDMIEGWTKEKEEGK